MSVSNIHKKVAIKGDVEPTPIVIKYSDDLIVNVDIPLCDLNILQAILEKLENEKGCSVWVSNMV